MRTAEILVDTFGILASSARACLASACIRSSWARATRAASDASANTDAKRSNDLIAMSRHPLTSSEASAARAGVGYRTIRFGIRTTPALPNPSHQRHPSAENPQWATRPGRRQAQGAILRGRPWAQAASTARRPQDRRPWARRPQARRPVSGLTRSSPERLPAQECRGRGIPKVELTLWLLTHRNARHFVDRHLCDRSKRS